MSEDTHTSRSGVVTVVTAVIGLLAAMVSAGLIHANSSQAVDQLVPAPTSTPAPGTAPPTASQSTAWKAQAIAVCAQAQDLLDANVDNLSAVARWDAQAFFGQVTRDMDGRLKQVTAPADVTSRILLMVQDWDVASDALIRAGAAGDRGDMAQYQQDLADFSDPNGRGNQIADDLGLAACAQVALP